MNTMLIDNVAVPSRSGKGRAKERRLHLTLNAEDIAVITFDHPDKAANIFDEETLDELHVALSAVESLTFHDNPQ